MNSTWSCLAAVTAMLALGAGCGGSDDGNGNGNGGGGGSVGGADITTIATAACNAKFAGGCPQDDKCVADFQEDQDIESVFGCAKEHEAYVACLGKYTWTCEAMSGGGYSFQKPAECSPELSDYLGCSGSYSYTGGTTSCQGSGKFDGQDLEADCSGGPGACTCTSGPKQGTAFSIAECDQPEFLVGSKRTVCDAPANQCRFRGGPTSNDQGWRW